MTPLRIAAVAGALATATFITFIPALGCGYVNFDDPMYVLQNENVIDGINLHGVQWALSTFSEANWHPLTWISLQLDASLWRRSEGSPDPFGFHLTNVLLHSVNAGLLFLALRAMTCCFWRSFVAALLFSVHPLRVESVAWISERKDVLCAFFGLLALWAYARYAKSPSIGRYLLILLPFVLSLTAKSMMVTLPCLLLVLDWWPLRRWPERSISKLVVEKLPLLACTVASSVITLIAQSGAGAVVSSRSVPPLVRIENALLSYGFYLEKTIWPTNLAVFYPHMGLSDRGLDLGAVAIATIAVLAITIAAISLRKRMPYILAGWLWYLGTLVPVIGLVQVAGQAYADRYTYLPQVGLFIAFSWAFADLAHHRPRLVLSISCAGAVVLAVLTWRQEAYWHDAVSLWRHDLDCGLECPTALNNYGAALQDSGQQNEAIGYYRSALAEDSNRRDACLNLALGLQRQGNLDEALQWFGHLSRIDPASTEAMMRQGDILFQQRNFAAAADRYREAIQISSRPGAAYCNLGRTELALNRPDLAEAAYRKALDSDPSLAAAHNGLGSTFVRVGRLKDAIEELAEAIRLDPQSGQAHNNLGDALDRAGETARAAAEFERATQLSPGLAMPWANLARIRRRQGLAVEAVQSSDKAVALEPRSPELRVEYAASLVALAEFHAAAGRFEAAIAAARRAREQAEAVRRSDLVRDIDSRLSRYESKRTGPAPS
jgi:tetratricopeptide (TPR) repeat protein